MMESGLGIEENGPRVAADSPQTTIPPNEPTTEEERTRHFSHSSQEDTTPVVPPLDVDDTEDAIAQPEGSTRHHGTTEQDLHHAQQNHHNSPDPTLDLIFLFQEEKQPSSTHNKSLTEPQIHTLSLPPVPMNWFVTEDRHTHLLATNDDHSSSPKASSPSSVESPSNHMYPSTTKSPLTEGVIPSWNHNPQRHRIRRCSLPPDHVDFKPKRKSLKSPSTSPQSAPSRVSSPLVVSASEDEPPSPTSSLPPATTTTTTTNSSSLTRPRASTVPSRSKRRNSTMSHASPLVKKALIHTMSKHHESLNSSLRAYSLESSTEPKKLTHEASKGEKNEVHGQKEHVKPAHVEPQDASFIEAEDSSAQEEEDSPPPRMEENNSDEWLHVDTDHLISPPSDIHSPEESEMTPSSPPPPATEGDMTPASPPYDDNDGEPFPTPVRRQRAYSTVSSGGDPRLPPILLPGDDPLAEQNNDTPSTQHVSPTTNHHQAVQVCPALSETVVQTSNPDQNHTSSQAAPSMHHQDSQTTTIPSEQSLLAKPLKTTVNMSVQVDPVATDDDLPPHIVKLIEQRQRNLLERENQLNEREKKIQLLEEELSTKNNESQQTGSLFSQQEAALQKREQDMKLRFAKHQKLLREKSDQLDRREKEMQNQMVKAKQAAQNYWDLQQHSDDEARILRRRIEQLSRQLSQRMEAYDTLYDLYNSSQDISLSPRCYRDSKKSKES